MTEVGDRRSQACCGMAMGTTGLTGSVVAETRKMREKMDSLRCWEMALRFAGHQIVG
jgi:hypothetical protein